jgi:hypothetical protein
MALTKKAARAPLFPAAAVPDPIVGRHAPSRWRRRGIRVLADLLPHLAMTAMGTVIFAIVLVVSHVSGKADDPDFQSALAITLVGAVPLLFGAIGTFLIRRRIRRAVARSGRIITVPGVVTAVDTKKVKGDSVARSYPTFRFTTVDGQQREVPAQRFASKLRVGDAKVVGYDPADETWVEVAGEQRKIVLLMGLLFVPVVLGEIATAAYGISRLLTLS